MGIDRIYRAEDSLRLMGDLGRKWADIVVPLFGGREGAGAEAEGVGSAFFIQKHRRHFLATACHVLDDLRDYDAVVTNVGGRAVPIAGQHFHTDRPNDVAVSELTEAWFERNDVRTIRAISLDEKRSGPIPSGYFLLLGYPGARNVLELRRRKTNRYHLSVTVEKSTSTAPLSTHVASPVRFSFDPGNALDAHGNRFTPPQLQGMSGGPAIEVLVEGESRGGIAVSVRLAGVVVAREPRLREVVAADAASVHALIDRIVSATKAR